MNDLTRFRKRNKKHDISAALPSLSVKAKMSDDSREKKSVDERQKSQSRGPGYESTEVATNSGKPSAARRGKDRGKSEGSLAGSVQSTVSAEREAAAAQALEEKRAWSIYSGHYDRPTSIRATETQKPVVLKSVEVFPSRVKSKKLSSTAGQAHDAAAVTSQRINAKAIKYHFGGSHYSNLPDDSDNSKVAEEPSYLPMQVKLDKDVTVLDNVLYAERGDLTSKTFV